MSEFNTQLTFLFLLFDAPYLKRFGIFSIQLSIIFFSKYRIYCFGWSPCIFLDLVNFQSILFLFVLSVISFNFFLFLLPCLVFVYLSEQTLLFFLCFSFISSTDGSCFSHSYVPKQVFCTYFFMPCHERCTVGQIYYQWDSSSSKYYFLSRLLFFLPPKFFFNIDFATSPKIDTTADAKSPFRNPFPLYFLYLFILYFYSYIYI